MSITARDRKVILVVLPLVVLLAYWFLLLAPQRNAASAAGEELTKQEQARDQARDQLALLKRAKTSFPSDYAQLVGLGKAIPSTVDMPSLLLQLDRAARGTNIRFGKISAGARTAAAPPTGGSGAAPAPGGATTPAAAGGTPAQSGPGQAAEVAGGAAGAASGQAAAGTVTPQDAQTSTQARDGKLAVGGAAGAAAPAAGGQETCAPGLECLPLTLEFRGEFFDLADFFHRLKRFVKLENENIRVRGRLLTIDGLKFSDDEGKLKAEITATVYLAPKAEGVTAGATPQGPATTPAGSTAAPGPTQPAGSAPGPGQTQPASAPPGTGTP